MSPTRPGAPRTVRTLTAVVVALVLALVAGCGVRLETPPPEPLVPDVNEQARQRASADAATLAALAEVPPAAPDAAPDPVADARAAVVAEASTHLDLLGGLYTGEPGGEDRDARPQTPAATPEPEPTTATPDAVLALLTESAATARADADTVTDGPLARLLGSVSVSRLLSASRLAAAAGLAPPAVPEGIPAVDLAALVTAEDAAGYGLEVVAAKGSGDLRTRAHERAATHRSRAQGWADLAGIDGTGLDPRRVAYALPPGLEDPATAAGLAGSLETTLAGHYASLVAGAPPGARAALVDAVAEASAQASSWGAPLPALPGLPERAEG